MLILWKNSFELNKIHEIIAFDVKLITVVTIVILSLTTSIIREKKINTNKVFSECFSS